MQGNQHRDKDVRTASVPDIANITPDITDSKELRPLIVVLDTEQL